MGAIGNIINSAAMDSNEGGTSDHLQEAMKQDLEVGNMAFMGFPTIYWLIRDGKRQDRRNRRGNRGGRHAVQLGRLCGRYQRLSEKRSSHVWRASELFRQQRQTSAC
jgi:hypothetical protein